MNTMKTQFAVVGGGPAGICAALAAARSGLDTILVQNRPVLGGNSSSEIRVWSRGALGAGNLYGEEMGIWGELKLTNLYRNADGNPVFWDEVLLDAVLAEKKLTLLLNTDITELTMEASRIARISGYQQGTEQHILIEAETFLDATGDSTLGFLANVPFYLGEEYIASRDALLPEKPELLSCSLLFNTRLEDHPVRFFAPDYAYDLNTVAGLLGAGGRIASEKMGESDCWWFEYGGNLNTIAASQDITLELKKLVMGVWNFIKNSGKYPAENYTLEWVGSVPAKRESRRMVTDYLLKTEDLLEGKTFPDGAFYGGWYRDMHPSGGIQDTGEDNCVQIPVNVYQIPLSCLYAKEVPNLLFAGRNIGTQRQVFVSSRVMNTCALAGQAAALLAVEMIHSRKAPQMLSPAQVEKIRLELTRQDVFIPGACLTDSADLAPMAAVTASSFHDGTVGTCTCTLALVGDAFITLPGVENCEALLTVEATKPAVLRGKWYTSSLPNRFLPGSYLADWQAEVPQGRSDISLILPKGCEAHFCTLCPEDHNDVRILCTAPLRTGFVCGHRGSPAYAEPVLHYRQKVDFYAPEQAVTGWDRPWNRPNQWKAAPADKTPWLELRWKQIQTISEVVLFLDPNLNEELPSSRAKYYQDSHFFVPRDGMPKALIRNASLQIQQSDGRWKAITALKNNRQRRVLLKLPQDTKSSALRLQVENTWGDCAAVYQIRVY